MKVFISYRREDSGGHAEMLARELRKESFIGDDGVFFDVAPGAIPPGARFSQQLRQGAADADVVFEMIGPNWLRLLNERADEKDHLVEELETAIEGKKVIVPVLVAGASMPKAHELQPSIRGLAQLQAVVLPPGRFSAGYQELIKGIQPLIKQAAIRHDADRERVDEIAREEELERSPFANAQSKIAREEALQPRLNTLAGKARDVGRARRHSVEAQALSGSEGAAEEHLRLSGAQPNAIKNLGRSTASPKSHAERWPPRGIDEARGAEVNGRMPHPMSQSEREVADDAEQHNQLDAHADGQRYEEEAEYEHEV